MTEPGPGRRGGARGARGFTLLEIMIALAILAVGSVCVLSTFAAALSLHLRREADVRDARVLEEARQEAQGIWDAFYPSRGRPLPAATENLLYSRDSSVIYGIAWEPVAGQPRGLDGTVPGANAVIRIRREGQDPARARTMRVFVLRSGFRPEDLKGSLTLEMEKEADRNRKNESESKKAKPR